MILYDEFGGRRGNLKGAKQFYQKLFKWKLGANIVLDFQPLTGMGAIGVFVDPTGASLGVWELEAKKPAKKKK